MKNYQKNYRKKTKIKTVTFYLHEKDIYDYASKLNFQSFVKNKLKEEISKNGKQNLQS